MAKTFASWVPGYSVVAQAMGGPTLDWNGKNFTDVNGLREGYGVHFRLQANQADWFHVAIPTPVLVEDKRATLARVMVLYEMPQGAAVNSVHVWDGPNRILQLDGLTISGDHFRRGVDADNTWNVNHDGIQWGVGVSLLVSARTTSDIYFATAGADFQHNI